MSEQLAYVEISYYMDSIFSFGLNIFIQINNHKLINIQYKTMVYGGIQKEAIRLIINTNLFPESVRIGFCCCFFVFLFLLWEEVNNNVKGT